MSFTLDKNKKTMTAINIIADSDFGLNAPFFFAQLFNLFIVGAWLWYSFKMISYVCKNASGSEVPLWILVIVLLPLLGAWAASLHYIKRDSRDKQVVESSNTKTNE